MEKVIHISIHPRGECRGICLGCYLQKQVDKKAVLNDLQLCDCLGDIYEFANHNGYTHVSYAVMVNTTSFKKMTDDVMLLATVVPFAHKLKAQYAEVYIGPDVIRESVLKVSWARKLIEWCTFINAVGADKQTETSLWISDLWKLYIMFQDNTAKIAGMHELIHDLSGICKVNMTATIRPSTNIAKLSRYIRELDRYLREPMIYLDMWDDSGRVSSSSIGKAMTLMRERLIGYNIEPDFCIVKNADEDHHKIATIFPDGKVKNCPYLEYNENGNNILYDRYCYDKCPHSIRSK